MTTVSLTVNGRAVTAQVAPRTHLADFLREHLLLTGTHLGCEHGVCGACTLLIDDAPARSCIAFAAVCQGARVQTIEGLEHDPVIALLRAAFTAEHALQCGYCTPGMLVTARDIVLRLPGADADRIRLELAGNLCRCTGYAGIVRAIQRVLREHPHADAGPRRGPSPNAGEGTPNRDTQAGEGAALRSTQAGEGELDRGTPAGEGAPGRTAVLPSPVVREGRVEEVVPVHPRVPSDQSIIETVRIAVPLDRVWAALQDPALIAQCVPGARLTSIAPDQLTGELTAALGPIRAHFTGAARVAYRPDHTGTVEGEGQDLATKTHLRASAAFALIAASPGTSELTLTVTYALRGPLAQLGRGPIVRAFAAELAEAVARTLEARLRGTAPPTPPRLRLLPLFLRALRRWLRRGTLWRRGPPR
jgi:aerobic carbon-monoxide dehydrogenase small subunit